MLTYSAQKMNEIRFSSYIENAPVELMLKSYLHPSIHYWDKEFKYNFHDITHIDFDYKDAIQTIKEIKNNSINPNLTT